MRCTGIDVCFLFEKVTKLQYEEANYRRWLILMPSIDLQIKFRTENICPLPTGHSPTIPATRSSARSAYFVNEIGHTHEFHVRIPNHVLQLASQECRWLIIFLRTAYYEFNCDCKWEDNEVYWHHQFLRDFHPRSRPRAGVPSLLSFN